MTKASHAAEFSQSFLADGMVIGHNERAEITRHGLLDAGETRFAKAIESSLSTNDTEEPYEP